MGCRTKRERSQLIRFRYPDADKGRGAWVCKGSKECFLKAISRKGFERTLKVAVPREVLANWSSHFEDTEEVTSASSLY